MKLRKLINNPLDIGGITIKDEFFEFNGDNKLVERLKDLNLVEEVGQTKKEDKSDTKPKK